MKSNTVPNNGDKSELIETTIYNCLHYNFILFNLSVEALSMDYDFPRKHINNKRDTWFAERFP